MSCWVVPALAAEYWGVSINQVLQQARSGLIPTKTEYGFMLVDVAPYGPRYQPLSPTAHPPTFIGVYDSSGPQPVPIPADEPQIDMLSIDDEFIQADQPGDLSWRAARHAAALTRRPPSASCLLAA